MGMIVKSKKTQKLLVHINIKYNPNKKLQYCRTYSNKKGYISNIKNQWKSFFALNITIIVSPFLLLYQLYIVIQSLFPYSLVYTKKNLKEDNNE